MIDRQTCVMALVLASVPLSSPAAGPDGSKDYVGSTRCGACHQAEYQAWRGSDHDHAMAEAGPTSVLGDFSGAEITVNGVTSRFFRRDGGYWVHTDGPDGAPRDYRIAYTFGWEPLQQYLVEFPGGRLQSLGLAWDTRPKGEGGQRWFHLYPDDPPVPGDALHWTGRDQTWNYQCAECHSTHLEKGYDLTSDTYRTTWSEIDVACEACHGSGAAHAAWAEARGQDEDKSTGAAPADSRVLAPGLLVDLADRDGGTWGVDPTTGKPRRSVARSAHIVTETCARCHSRRGQIWARSRPGAPLHDSHRLALLEDALYFPDGQIRDEVYVHGSFIQSPMYRAGVTCGDCHDPHSLALRAEGNALCTRCHTAARYDDPAHHHHVQASPGAACTGCHMPERTYMVVDRRADHGMRVPRPDLSVRIGVPNACNACHEDRSAQWAADAVATWQGDGGTAPAHFGEILHAARAGEAGADDRLLALAGDAAVAPVVRATAVDEMRARARPENLFTIRRLLQDEDALVREAALRYLESVEMGARVDLAWPMLEDPARTVRLEAARQLAPLTGQRVPEPYRSRLGAALEEYRTSQAVNADRPESHLNLGLLAHAQGDARGAAREYQTALDLAPGFIPGYVNLADLYRALHRDDEAAKVLDQGIAVAPGNAALHYALGLTRVRQQRKTDALASLGRADALAPERPRFAFAHALLLDDLGRTQEARAVLESARERHPANGELLFALVNVTQKLGDLEAARAYAADLAGRYPDDARAAALVESLQVR